MQIHKNIDSYIKSQPKEIQTKLLEMRQLVKKAAPKATEAITYGMPTYVGKGNIVHFAGMKGHLGFYPAPSAITHFAEELKNYNTSKGCIRFPYAASLPQTLITQIVKFRVAEDKTMSK